MTENRIIGRDYEQHILQNICEEDEARLVAVHGRRRVGKTYLVKPSTDVYGGLCAAVGQYPLCQWRRAVGWCWFGLT